MKIEIQLISLMERYNINHHGAIRQIVQMTKANRQTISNLMHNRTTTVSLRQLGIICDWLIEKGVPRTKLPWALFGSPSDGLIEPLSLANTIQIYLGETFQKYRQDAPSIRWVSRRDAQVESKLTEVLSSVPQTPRILQKYVTTVFKYDPNIDYRKESAQDIENSEKTYHEMMSSTEENAMIIIGSPRSNPLSEQYLARLVKCNPFKPQQPSGKNVPIYIKYRSEDTIQTSVLGGYNFPAEFKKAKDGAGILYRDRNYEWVFWEWIERKQYIGTVVVEYDEKTNAIIVCLFGFSGTATQLMGDFLVRNEIKELWPPQHTVGSKRYSIVMCKFLVKDGYDPDDKHNLDMVEKSEFHSLDEKVIKKYIKKR